MEEPLGLSGWPRSPTPTQDQGKGRYENKAQGDTGTEREWVSGAGCAPQNPRTWERMWPPGAEKERLRSLEAEEAERSLETWEGHPGTCARSHTHTHTHTHAYSLQQSSLGCAGSSSSQDTIIFKCLSLVTSRLIRHQGGLGLTEVDRKQPLLG